MRLVLCVVAALACIVLAKEEGQQGRCSSSQYSCIYGTCIPNYEVCDGHEDCPYYGDDEDYCTTIEDRPTTNGCAGNQYQCEYDGMCISQSWVCDGYKDCPYYGDDEEYCTTTYDPPTTNECASTQYQCEYDGRCISQAWVCDGINDCPYGDDENNCYTHDFTTTTTHRPPFECPSTFDYIYDRCVLVNPFTITNWDEARYFCQKFSGDILIVDDFNFYSKLLHFIIKKGLDTHDYWVGARDQQEGVWRWVDSSPVHVGAPLWALFGCNEDYHLEPRQSDAEHQDCGYLDRDRGMYMNDASCDQHYAVICQSHGAERNTEEDTKAKEPTVIEEVKKAKNDHEAAVGKEEEEVEESNEEKEE